VVVVAAGELDRLGALGQGVDHEHVRPAVVGEAEVVEPVLEGGDAPRRLLLVRDVLVAAVAARLRQPRDVGDPGGVRAPGERLRPERVLADASWLAAVGGHDVELRLVLVAGAQEGDPAPVGREPRPAVALAGGEASWRRRAVGGRHPQVAAVGIGLQVDAPDRHHHQPTVR
jgi:hypothetical protein